MIIHRQQHEQPEGWPDAEMMEQAHADSTPVGSCMVCGHVAPFGVWNAKNPEVGVCRACKEAPDKMRKACEERAEAVNESILFAAKVHNLALQADLWRDEFLRIKALSPGPEIEGLCNRAISEITQRLDLIQQRDKAEKERDTLASQLAQAQQELFELQGDYLKLSSTCIDATARANRLEEQLAKHAKP